MSFRYHIADSDSSNASATLNNAIADVTLTIRDGEFVVLCGQSGCGKTTITRLCNGLIPAFYTGDLTGACTVYGLTAGQEPIEQYAAVVGSVFQNPKTQYFNALVVDELAFPCENAGWESAQIRERVAEVAQRFGINHLIDRSIFQLSGGEKQRIAVASACMLHPRLLVLDEPTSNLDHAAMDDLTAMLSTIAADGVTIVVAEHRLAWCARVADRYVLVESGRIVGDYSAADFAAIPESVRDNAGLRTLDITPYRRRVTDMAKCWPHAVPRDSDVATHGSDTAPRNVNATPYNSDTALYDSDATLRNSDTTLHCHSHNETSENPVQTVQPLSCSRAVSLERDASPQPVQRTKRSVHQPVPQSAQQTAQQSIQQPVLSTRGLVVGYRGRKRLADRLRRKETPAAFSLPIPDCDLYGGEIVGLMGHNGSGKSTLVSTLTGLAKPLNGTILHHGVPATPRSLTRCGFLVMQDVNYQLFADSVREELLLGAGDAADVLDDCDRILDELDLIDVADRHPMSLSGGQKQRTAIASALMCGKEIIVLDEPTSGLDRRHMLQVGALLRRLADKGKAVLVVTHDEELAAQWCDRILDLDHIHATTAKAQS